LANQLSRKSAPRICRSPTWATTVAFVTLRFAGTVMRRRSPRVRKALRASGPDIGASDVSATSVSEEAVVSGVALT
jgi:hypothetical protein